MRNKFVRVVLSAAISLPFAVSLLAQSHGGGQSRPGGPPMGGPGGMPEMGRPGSPMGAPGGRPDRERPSHSEMTQQPLRDAQIHSGAFRMLQQKSGLNSEQLQDLYRSSGAKNFGQFTSAIVVAKNLNLDRTAVLDGLKTMSLGETIKSLGVPNEKAKEAISEAKKQARDAEKNRG